MTTTRRPHRTRRNETSVDPQGRAAPPKSRRRAPSPADRGGIISTASPDVTTEALRDWVSGLRRVVSGDDSDRIEQLRVLEDLKASAAWAQARITLDLDGSQRAEHHSAGVPARRVGTGVAAQVALARRESPVAGARHLGLARSLAEMPVAARALSWGQVSEWRVLLLARETACLTRADRGTVDAEISARPGGLAALGDRAVERESRRIAYRLDPHAFTRRSAKAVSERCVSLRPAPDTAMLGDGAAAAQVEG